MRERKIVSVRITNQYRDRDVMTYELLCEGTRLTVRFLERAGEDDPAAWTAEVSTSEKVDALVVSGKGDTRAAALREAGREWSGALRGRPYAAFEWSGVVDALSTVRAL